MFLTSSWGLIDFRLGAKRLGTTIVVSLQAGSPLSQARAAKSKAIRREGVWRRGAAWLRAGLALALTPRALVLQREPARRLGASQLGD